MALTDPLTGAAAGQAPPDRLSRIGINNQLRKALRVALAQFDLSAPMPPCAWPRCARCCARSMPRSITLLRAQLARESSAAVKREIRAGLALADLDSDARPTCGSRPSGPCPESLNTDVYNRLSAMVAARRRWQLWRSGRARARCGRGALRTIDR